MVLAGLDAKKNFQQKVKFSESLQFLAVKVWNRIIQLTRLF
jgi:hypothetical protein